MKEEINIDELPTRQEGILFTIDCLNNHKYNFDYCLEELIKEAKQLQSNWNSLRRWLQEQNNFLEGIPTFTKEIEREHKIQIISYDYVLDKMNELESGEKN